ncbi:thiol-disulfide oxidoreductase ResA [Bacillus carboniphilus]|uniref:Thiol-disulfide oxidoreductase ResA n=1 Tax=Bacillus carboniphilus TaxID=86663 RepID=A0ABY9JWM6_9BACI|nr:thiol-disulfide oxidoreductase ResA [Bacillus carboniphilus]WLR43780.1 thiol-disulfide oxidoreductase ResA [Bacillus carboniphilus]
MKRKRLIIRTAILLLLISAISYTLYMNFFHSKGSVEIGDKAPLFVLENLQGEEVYLEDLQGKGVFLNFWGTWCEPCKTEMPYMQNQYEYYQGQGVEIVAVNIAESRVAVKKFVEEYGLTFPVVLDKNRDVSSAYDVGNLPATYLIDSDGIIVDIKTGQMTERDVQQYMEQIKP